MYKIETHLHTAYISHCGWLGAQAIIRAYAAKGYDAICVTDHYNRECFDYADIDLTAPGSKTEAFLLGYRRLEREGRNYGIKVYEGAELRFDGSENDYLLFGFHHELLADPDTVMKEGLEAFVPKSRADGAVLIQAHPYRTNCTPAEARLLDGVEVLNCNFRQENHNELALDYAKKNGLLMSPGLWQSEPAVIRSSDCHRPGDEGLSGIMTDILPEDGFELADLIRSGKYKLIKP